MEIDFFSQPGFGRSRALDPSRAINFFFETSNKQQAKSRTSLIGTPGFSLALTAGTGPIRALYNFGKSLYAVSGNELYYIAPNLTATALGALNTTTGPLSIADNRLYGTGEGGNQMAIVDGQSGYIYNPVLSSGNFSLINSPGLPPNPSDIVYIDSYFLCTNGTMAVSTSLEYDGTQWPATAIAYAQATADGIQGLVNLNDQLMVIKEGSSEGWYNNLTAPQMGSPFSLVPGAVGDYGAGAAASIAQTRNGTYFIGTQIANGPFCGIVEMTSYNSQAIISPASIDYRISQIPKISDAFSFTYDMEGHTFYVTTFPSAKPNGWTLVYDLTTKHFFEWSFFDSSGDPDEVGRHVASCYAYAYGKHFIGDYNSGNIYQLSSSTYTDNGNPIISTWISDLYTDKMDFSNISYQELEVAAEVGYGDPTKSGPPVAELSWSNDAGMKWSNTYPVSMGFVGESHKRLRWRRLGRGRNRVWKFRCSEPIRKVFVSAVMKVS